MNRGEQREDFAPDCYLVDLPGYGYATASVEITEKWGRMVERYLRTSGKLKIVFLLVDIRHKPSANDRMRYDWICQSGMEPVIIATKLDKIKPSQKDKALREIRNGLSVRSGTKVIPFSSQTKEGRDEVWGMIRSL